jgi:hypothetical protein
VQSSDNRDCDIRRVVRNSRMAEPKEIKTTQPEAVQILTRLDAMDLKQRDLADALSIHENKLSKVRAGERQMKAGEVLLAHEWLDAAEARGGYIEEPDLPPVDPQRSYLPVEILPSYAGMGGGGSGEGDVEHALVSRSLIEDELHAKATDLLVIDARGTSMEPEFEHGDQILIDRRDKNTAQPGAFALWDGDAYVIKMVERVPQTQGARLRVFSRDKDLSAHEYDAEDLTIMGRPVWFGRRL